MLHRFQKRGIPIYHFAFPSKFLMLSQIVIFQGAVGALIHSTDSTELALNLATLNN